MKVAGVKWSLQRFDIMYVEGPGDVVESFRLWSNKGDLLSETSRTYSGQFFDFCQANKFKTFVMSYSSEHKKITTDQFHIINVPKTVFGTGVLYHLTQIVYGIRLIGIAFWLRPRYISLTTGVTYWFMLAPLRLLGIKIIPQLHNCLWPRGHYPNSLLKRILLYLDGWFFRYIACMSLCVSPEIQRQIETITNFHNKPIYQFRAQFNRKDFVGAPPPLSHEFRPFRIVFAGRVEKSKGVFDILKMAEKLHDYSVVFDICGGGSSLGKLKEMSEEVGVNDCVTIHGKLDRVELLQMYASAHVIIVPTRSDFHEGFSMVVAESVLMNRPVICSSVVPAVEVLRDAVVEVPEGNIESYIDVIQKLMTDSAYYELLCKNCQPLKEQFLNGEQGLEGVLQAAFSDNFVEKAAVK